MKIKDGFVLEEVGGSYLAVAVGQRTDEFTGLVRLNETGAFLWKHMKEDTTLDELIAALAAECVDADEETVKPGVCAFVENLRANGILEE